MIASTGFLIQPISAVAPGWALLANQFEEPNAALTGLFTPMPDGTYLPDGAEISTWNPSSKNWSQQYFWNSGAWSAGASTNFLWPGQAFFLWNPNSSSITVTFAGSVRVGGGPSPIAGGIPMTSGVQSPISSIVPQPGGLTSALGYSPSQGDQVSIWDVSIGNSDQYTYSGTSWSPRQPALASGQGFMITPGASQTWNRVWLPECDSLW